MLVAAWALVALAAIAVLATGARRPRLAERFLLPLNSLGQEVVDAGRATCYVKPSDAPFRSVPWLLAPPPNGPEGSASKCYLPEALKGLYGCAPPGAAAPSGLDGSLVAAGTPGSAADARRGVGAMFDETSVRSDVVPGVDVCAVTFKPAVTASELTVVGDLVASDVVRTSGAYKADVAAMKAAHEAAVAKLNSEHADKVNELNAARAKALLDAADSCTKQLGDAQGRSDRAAKDLAAKLTSETLAKQRAASDLAECQAAAAAKAAAAAAAKPEEKKAEAKVETKTCAKLGTLAGTAKAHCGSCTIEATGNALPCRLTCWQCDDLQRFTLRSNPAFKNFPHAGNTITKSIDFAAFENGCPTLEVDYQYKLTGPRLEVKNSCQFQAL